jgi:lactoylglutathione lyase
MTLHHIGVYTRDIELSRRFYQDMLGFDLSWSGEVPLPAGLFKAAMMRCGTCVIELVQPPDGSRVGTEHGPVQHIALKTKELRNVVKRMADKGAVFENGRITAMPEFTAHGVWHVFLLGPSGERIELVEDMPARADGQTEREQPAG